MALKILAKKHRIPIRKKGFGGVYGIGRIDRQEVMLFEPLTYMNLSGGVVEAVRASKLERQEDLLVVGDDVNLPIGRIRLREKGSSGGHNGLQSIIDRIGTNFARLRLGVGTDRPVEDMSAYVLSPFSRRERAVLGEMLAEAANCIETWLVSGTKEAMNRHNSC